jgi:hypothetical protein
VKVNVLEPCGPCDPLDVLIARREIYRYGTGAGDVAQGPYRGRMS